MQHNVLTWDQRKYDLSNTYRQLDPDIILINSHGLTDDSRLKIPGYRVHQTNLSNERHDGVAIAVKSRLRHRVDDDFISETLAVEIDTSDGPVAVATSYLPPRRPYLPHPDFLRLFRRRLPLLFAGDLNARHPDLGTRSTNTVGRDLVDYLRRQTAHRLGPDFPTYYGPLSRTSPDIVLTNPSNHFNHHISPGPLTSSDHIPIIIDMSSSPILIPAKQYFSFRTTDWTAFTSDADLQMTDEPDISRSRLDDIDDALESWTTKVKTAVDRHVPRKTFKPLPHNNPSRQTQLLKIQFDALRERAERYGWNYNDYRRYTQLRLTLHDARIAESDRSWGRALEDLSARHSDPKTFWRRLNCLSGKSKGPDTDLTDDQGRRLSSEEEKERVHTARWRRVFSDDPDDDDSDYDDDNDNVVRTFLNANVARLSPHATADPARFTGDAALACRISAQEVRGALRGSKATAPGQSGINKLILSRLPDSAMERLTAIMNASLSAGYFPDQWKEAHMRMICKPGKPPARPDSYRPISLLEVPGKLFERVINGRLRDHLEWEDLHSPAQYGFRRGRGTTHAIALATEAIALHLSSRSRCNIVLRDVSKAFDKVWHLGLKFKMLHLGLPAHVERLLCDFLADRTARIGVGGHTGPAFPLQTGVPQGSVLSPTLYTVYTRDCPSSVAGINIQYADDVTQIIFYAGRSREMANARTAREVSRINEYERRWRIRTNVAKFKVLPLATVNPPPLIIEGDAVPFSARGSILGLQIGRTGYSSHVRARAGQARRALTTLYRFRSIDTKIKTHIIKTKILPILTYPPTPLHALSHTAISKLQKIQNAALRFALGVRWDDFRTNKSLHEEADIPPLNTRLHELAFNVWEAMAVGGWRQYEHLRALHEDAGNSSHLWFPRSLPRLGQPPEPCYY